MTASTLYEAVEPEILWRHVLTTVFDEIMGDGSKTEVFIHAHPFKSDKKLTVFW